MTKPLFTRDWIHRLDDYERLVVGFSGGLDSTVLLHALAFEVGLCHKLLAVHIHHGLSDNADAWQRHCENSCLNWGVAFHTTTVLFNRQSNIEEEARDARYAIFSSLLTKKDALLLGHHLGDQAETVLLQLFRGAGIEGLSAMTESGSLGLGCVLRPFLSHDRPVLEDYARAHNLIWVDDESNQDNAYSRNHLRNKIMPLLLEKWPGVVGNLGRTAIHCQQAQLNLHALAQIDGLTLSLSLPTLPMSALEGLCFDRIANLLRVWLKRNQVKLPSTATFHRLIHEVIGACDEATPQVSWGDIQIRRYQNRLYLDKKHSINPPDSIDWIDFPNALVVDNKAYALVAKKADLGFFLPEKAKLQVRFRQGGESVFWKGQHKKLKKLFQEWHIPPWEREQIPLLFINDKLAVIVGHAVGDLFFTQEPAQAWNISILAN